MPARTILQLGNPDLWQSSQRVESPAAAQALIQDLADTLAAFREKNGFGRGIAAPQIGVHQRLIFVNVPGGFSGPLINPQVVWSSEEQMVLWDDCFSLPGLMVRVARAAQVRVSFQNQHGEARSIEADRALSELLQHEIDHLDGILAVQRAISPQALCTRAEWERRYRDTPA
ncbi:peptide deformylase [Haliangium ochraceum]|uniref:Peptide deformylase n=1 Tax=Haliangium ochraceum (strain DSM 14365 / JCM 11303 / SMP-2) TaxID=502025 RepID=D0LMG6_HALO1|nr:peptide deformylase [Haliangium ochraceum]ACY18653.1 formylmethionine deformylase [Haliangium ochraceum DSM 14365]